MRAGGGGGAVTGTKIYIVSSVVKLESSVVVRIVTAVSNAHQGVFTRQPYVFLAAR